MMTIIRWLVGFLAIVALATIAFGQESPASLNTMPQGLADAEGALYDAHAASSLYEAALQEELLQAPKGVGLETYPSSFENVTYTDTPIPQEANLRDTSTLRPKQFSVNDLRRVTAENTVDTPLPARSLEETLRANARLSQAQTVAAGGAAAEAAPAMEAARTAPTLSDDVLEQILMDMQSEDNAMPVSEPKKAPTITQGNTPPKPIAAEKTSASGVSHITLESITWEAPAAAGAAALTPAEVKDTGAALESLEESLTRQVEALSLGHKADSYGTLGDKGGLGENLWQDLNMKDAEALLARLDKPFKSTAAARVYKRALLSKATPPKEAEKTNWVVVRGRALLEQGMASAALVLVKGYVQDPQWITRERGLAQLWTEVGLLNGDSGTVCPFVQEQILNNNAAFWRQALWSCQAITGDKNGLDLSLRMNPAQAGQTPSYHRRLLQAVLEKRTLPKRDQGQRLSMLSMAVLGAYPQMVSDDVLAELPDLTLRQLVNDTRLPLERRAAIAEELVNTHSLAADALLLTELYEKFSFDAEDLKAPLRAVEMDYNKVEARALLWQGIQKADLASNRALILKKLWDMAEEDSLYSLPGMLMPDRRGIQPQANLAWFAPHVVRYALLSDNMPVARKWWRVLEQNASISADLTAAKHEFALVFALIDRQMDEKALNAWLDGRKGAAVDEPTLEPTRVLTLLEALELPISDRVWRRVSLEAHDAPQTQTMNALGPVWLKMVGSSLNRGARGEAILLLLQPMGHTGAADMHLTDLANVVSGFRFSGLTHEAQSLALEALLGANPVQ